ncbi:MULTISPECIES: FAD-dependent oxidoreductase [unclassified Mycobacterium]|uniref:NAD(P)/FAD-dependent oxidoreductase n=1 Tax=unclassified Mycobacterium TaxID=2642494 RepID=UPI00048B5942|nr:MULTISPECIES: FAD-dependent oxidoreductase [unclassified Mycobacterium]SEA05725.1 Glycine/D-amino acid oxidase [Mycobacterium sp. 283mftsu]
MEYLFDTGWVARPEVTAPSLEGEIRCDIAIIGGGLGGMAAGLRLAERGADVVVLEAGICGWGASTRNGGHLSDALSGDPRMLGALYPRRLPGIVRFAESAMEYADELIERLGIECDYQRTGNVAMVSSSAREVRSAKQAAKVLRSAGSKAEYVDAREFGLPHGFLGGIFEPGGGLVNPGKYTLGVRDALLASGARVFEHTPVLSVDSSGNGLVISVPDGKIRAERALLTTNAYSTDLAFAPPRLATPLWVTVFETEPIDPERIADTGWTSGAGFTTNNMVVSNFRPTPHNTIVCGTRQVQSAQGPLGVRSPEPVIVKDLLRGFRDRFPSLRDVAPRRTWGGWVAMTPSFLPVAGQSDPRVLFALGCNGYGLTQAPYLGSLLADRLMGDEPHANLKSVWTDRTAFPPNLPYSAPAVRALWALDRVSDHFSRHGH